MINNLNYILSRAGSCRSIFIAGGAAVNFDKAGDVDVWFGNNNTEAAEKFFESYPIRFNFEEKDYEHHTFKVIGSAWDEQVQKIVQVIVSKKKTPIEVMDEFDISTHMVAFNKGEFIRHPIWTASYDPPKILKWKPKTFERYVKICQRYGHPIDLEQLKEFVEQGEENKEKSLKASVYEMIDMMNKKILDELISPYYTSKSSDDDIPF